MTTPSRIAPIGPSSADTIRRRLSGAARGYVLMTVATMGTSFVVQIGLAKALGPVGLGEYAATSLFFVALTTLALFGVPSAISQRIASFDEARSGLEVGVASVALGLALVTGALASLIGIALWIAFARFAELLEPAPALIVASAAFGSIMLHFTGSFLVARMEMRLATLLFIVQPVVVGAGLLARGLIPLDGSTLAALGFLGGGIASGLTVLKRGIRPLLSATETRLLLRRGVSASIVPYAAFVSAWVDRGVVVAIAGTAGLGWFTAASYMTESILRLPRSLGAFGVPAYARLAEDPVGARRVLDSHLRILATFLLVTSAFFVAAGGGLLTFLFREDFVFGSTALRLLAIGLVPTGIALTLAGNLVGTGRFDHATRVMLMFVPLHLVAAVLATNVLSVAGTALASVVVWAVVAGLLALGSGIPFRTFAEMTGASVPVWAIAWVMGTRSIAWPTAGMLGSGVALLAAALFLIRGPELRVLRHLAGRDSGRQD